MTDVYFNDLFNILHDHLIHATKSVNIAVAWIDFKMFCPIFDALTRKKISVYIIADDNHTNQKYQNEIQYLQQNNMLKFIKMPGYSIMHEKFCIIDNKEVLVGSYNWTNNASNNNFENLMYCDEKLFVQKFIFEFLELKNVTYDKIYNLQKSQTSPILNICCIYEESDALSKIQIKTIKDGCVDETKIERYYDISIYNNIVFLRDDIYSDDESDEETKRSTYEFELYKYIVTEIEPLLNIPIHAIAFEAYDLYYDNTEDRYLKVIWKNRFISNLIDDRYDL